ncbi:MAG TPA: GntP family permease [Stenomitos sp.]
MSILITLAALAFLIAVAYRGFSVILFAPVAALMAVALSDPSHVLPYFSGVYMEKMVGFIKLYFPVFILGATFGKLIELSGFSKSIIKAVIRLVGAGKAMLSIVLVCALLTYGGVSLFVVAFSVYPFAAELFRQADIPKRLIPGTIALGAFTFTMDALPGSPQIQNLIPTTFFKTTTWSAPWLGTIGATFVLIAGLTYLERQRRKAIRNGEGYGTSLVNEPAAFDEALPHPAIALLPLVVVGVLNRLFTVAIANAYGTTYTIPNLPHTEPLDISKLNAVWAVEGALLIGILMVAAFAFRSIRSKFNAGMNVAVGGALLATMNTASEYGFGAVIAALPGFKAVTAGMAHAIGDPLVNQAVTITTLSGMTGSASGGMSIALASMAETYLARASALGIPAEVLHRVASMASGGMDTLPHNGAVITLLAVTGLTHRESYKDIFAMTLIKTAAVFLVIGAYYALHLV